MGKRSRRRGEQGVAEGEPEQNGAESPAEDPQGGPSPLRPDGRLREASLLVEEADYVYALYRWVVLTGEVPKANEWLRREDWPHPDYVIDVFGSWEKFLAHADLPASPLLARLREADAALKGIGAREAAAGKDLARVEDLKRQVETAKRRREAADAERAELSARAERLAASLGRAEERAAQAEAHLAERRAAAEEAAAGAGEEASAEWLTAHEALQDELEAVRAHRDGLLAQVEELQEASAADAKSISRLGAALAEASSPTFSPETEENGPVAAPGTVAEAVARAQDHAAHLVFTQAAHDSAADSPYRRPADVLEALGRLDELATMYADPDGFGRSLSQAAGELGLTWKGNVSELARSRKPNQYTITHDGARLELGPHVAIGSGSGAGFIARIYLHVADGSGAVPRGLYVGHVGRHLPDTTTG
ncbi:MAG: hypothetical protein ABI950_07435 [Solirubrobacteraceae bacterium]